MPIWRIAVIMAVVNLQWRLQCSKQVAEASLPVEPEALAELLPGNRLAPQAHLNAVGR